jgi:hypothetical protein
MYLDVTDVTINEDFSYFADLREFTGNIIKKS